MLHRLSTLMFAIVVSAVATQNATAQRAVPLHLSGSGFFSPVNIGTAQGGSFGVVLGDGSGLSEYTGSGHDFTIGGSLVGSGHNGHVGANRSWTTGILSTDRSLVSWPTMSSQTHVITSEQGNIHMRYAAARYFLNLQTGQFGGEGNFQIIGGTGRFAGARGMTSLNVLVTAPGDPAPFNYEFDGFIVLRD